MGKEDDSILVGERDAASTDSDSGIVRAHVLQQLGALRHNMGITIHAFSQDMSVDVLVGCVLANIRKRCANNGEQVPLVSLEQMVKEEISQLLDKGNE